MTTDDRAVAALGRQWGIDPADARDAIDRLQTREARLGRKVALEWTWAPHPAHVRAPLVVDLTAVEDRCDVA